MGLRAQIIVHVVATVFLTLLAGGFVRSQRAAADLQEVAVDHGLEVLRALAAPCSVPLATGQTEELDRVLASFTAASGWGRLDMLEISVVDLEGRVVAHTDPRRFGRLQEDDFTQQATRADHPISRTLETSADRRVRMGMPIVSSLRWGTVTATLSLQRVDDFVSDARRAALLDIALYASLIGAMLYVLLSVLVLRPMRDLGRAVQRLADGDLQARVEERRRSPEFALLARVFNHLAQRVDDSTRRLETQVQERTQALEAANAELGRLAATDGLTGLANHRSLHGQLDVEVARARRDGGPLAMVMIDVDHFKAFNDAHGHPAGDAVLAGIGALLRSRLRSTDLAARYGGEEFAVLLPHTGLEAAQGVAEQLVAAARGLRFPGSGVAEVGVTISAGVAHWAGHHESAAELLARADSALYAAKAGGRDRVVASVDAAPAGPEGGA